MTSDTDDQEFESIFDGKTLDGWDGDSTYWRVQDGNIIGEVKPETLLKQNVFLIWRKGRVKDFELKLDYQVSPDGNSGINYRSEEITGVEYRALRGYQADLDGRNEYTGMNYEERKRTTLATRGEKVTLPPVPYNEVNKFIKDNQWTARTVTAQLGNRDSLKTFVTDGWNEYHIVARHDRLMHYVNGVLMSDVTDNDTANRRLEGLLGVQVHVGPPMKIAFRNLRLKRL